MRLLEPSVVSHNMAELHMELAQGQARRGLHEMARLNFRYAATHYAECGCNVFSALADDAADAEGAQIRPTVPVNVAALVD